MIVNDAVTAIQAIVMAHAVLL
jgi:hypothetical protein